jgi:hypothetical protein
MTCMCGHGDSMHNEHGCFYNMCPCRKFRPRPEPAPASQIPDVEAAPSGVADSGCCRQAPGGGDSGATYTDEDVERVARAIAASRCPWEWRILTDGEKKAWSESARAAIRAYLAGRKAPEGARPFTPLPPDELDRLITKGRQAGTEMSRRIREDFEMRPEDANMRLVRRRRRSSVLGARPRPRCGGPGYRSARIAGGIRGDGDPCSSKCRRDRRSDEHSRLQALLQALPTLLLVVGGVRLSHAPRAPVLLPEGGPPWVTNRTC